MPSLPQSQEDLDKRSEKTRLFFASNLKTYAGLSYHDQSNFTSKISDTWATLTEPINAQRRNCHESVGLSKRYMMAIGTTLSPLLWSRQHRPRRIAMFWALGTWFFCPEWGRAYWRPNKPLSVLLKEQQQSEDGGSTSTPATPPKPVQ